MRSFHDAQPRDSIEKPGDLLLRLFRNAPDRFRRFCGSIDSTLPDLLKRDVADIDLIEQAIELLQNREYLPELRDALLREHPRQHRKINATFRGLDLAAQDGPVWDISEQLERKLSALTIGATGDKFTVGLCRIPRGEPMLWRPVVTTPDSGLHQVSIELRNPSPALRVQAPGFFRNVAFKQKLRTLPVHDLSCERRLMLEETSSHDSGRWMTEIWVSAGSPHDDKLRFRLSNQLYIEVTDARRRGCLVLVNFPKAERTDTLLVFEA